MDLLVDIGNSALKYLSAEALFAGEAPVCHAYVDAGLEAVLARQWAALPPPTRVTVACVAREAGEILRQWCERHWGVSPHFLKTGMDEAGVTNGYTEPAQLGIDRWAALVGAHSLGPANYCIVDAGTAVTVDFLDARGHHHGGLILPGARLMHAAVAGQVDALAGDVVPPPTSMADGAFPGRDTHACLAAGCRTAMVGFVREALVRAQALFEGPPRCLLCGGDAAELLAALAAAGTAARHRPELVLRGVARLAGLAVA
ncbi:MAG TPA: type III pantothenate kinase [Gammaproteobacteria bacterium]|nr:type III pantothenate kinase [Gammaproteobacteria bacterium]